MMERKRTPYGSWVSPVTSDAIARNSLRMSDLHADEGELYWIEGRTSEGGRCLIVKYCDDCRTIDITPEGFNVRTAVHEYGGGAFAVQGGTAFFSNYDDARIYMHPRGSEPYPISAPPEGERSVRYADFDISPNGGTLFCVMESHPLDGGEVINSIASLSTDGVGALSVLLSGHDFYAAPRISPNGQRLAWLQWDHPDMPWDAAELWVGTLREEGVKDAKRIAGGEGESIAQPEWSPDGVPHFVSDRTGWWNLYTFENGSVSTLIQMEAEFAEPAWVFGMSRYGFLSDGSIICAPITRGRRARLGIVKRGKFYPLDVPYTEISYLQCDADIASFIGAGYDKSREVVSLDVSDGKTKVIKQQVGITPEHGYISMPEAVTFPTSEGDESYAFFYPPTNAAYEGPVDEKPPAIVISHGGPTGAASDSLDLSVQFWTTRGFAVVDVNYRGSSGYGREYRRRLNGKWGVYEVDDCISAVRFLAERGDVDEDRAIIHGSSAGGYTTLCALVFRDAFSAGASYYGVGDVEALAKYTHKFEARYLDRLIAPYPKQADLYRQRSPIHFVDGIACPVILFQGSDDRVVPREQADAIANALNHKKLPYAYLLFEGEQHGFRGEDTIRRALEAELWFYGKVFGFTVSGNIQPVETYNLP